ncbi:unnamed protein product [Clonostachys rosea]|uniref:2EXR domain-containing protein n=1 Tax=Bionectria ochroleuca TaxID=29856 RepID=A0ABY6UN73_BIOOC|nr:unnamed protein product [Clonostachys rosea]
MSVFQPRFQTYNRLHFSDEEPATEITSFHLFPRLPVEVRLKIWENALSARRRLLTVRLAPSDLSKASASYTTSVVEKPRISPLWSICQESRQAAHEFFRLPVHIGKDLTLWVNPENDHVFITDFQIETHVLVHFINDLKTSDPQSIGLLHIALDSLCTRTLKCLRALSPYHTEKISQEAISTFKEWIISLQSIWFIHLLSDDSRLGFGVISGTKNYTIMGLNRSMPIFPRTVEFKLFECDLRPIQPSLEGQTVWRDPKCAVQAWVEMEKKLGCHSQESGKKEPIRQISHILAMGGKSDYHHSVPCDVICRKMMDDLLQRDQEDLHQLFIDGPGQFLPREAWEETEERKKNLLSAAGFWIFPLGTFDTLNEELAGKAYQDLSGQQPGLGLFEL